jgi:ribosome biogenesis protein Tsr3
MSLDYTEHPTMADAMRQAAHNAKAEKVSFIIWKERNRNAWSGNSRWFVTRFGTTVIDPEWAYIHRVYHKRARRRTSLEVALERR